MVVAITTYGFHSLALIFSLPCQQMSQQRNHYTFDLSTSFNHDHKPATLQPVDLTVEVAYHVCV